MTDFTTSAGDDANSRDDDAKIEAAVALYQRQYDYYFRLAQITRDRINSELSSAAIRAVVSFRAKSLESLRDKLRLKLAGDATSPAEIDAAGSPQEILDQIKDLAGVRIALYFPAEIVKVEAILSAMFQDNADKKVFNRRVQTNDLHGSAGPVETSVFPGYRATHFRVCMRRNEQSPELDRFAGAMVEVQIASVLMHAWAEVNHDLAYKKQPQALSHEELVLLDELNGLVVAGELALGLLQRAIEKRVESGDSPFNDHYELAAFLERQLPRVDSLRFLAYSTEQLPLKFFMRLLTLLRSVKHDSPSTFEPILSAAIGAIGRGSESSNVRIDSFTIDRELFRAIAIEIVRADPPHINAVLNTIGVEIRAPFFFFREFEEVMAIPPHSSDVATLIEQLRKTVQAIQDLQTILSENSPRFEANISARFDADSAIKPHQLFASNRLALLGILSPEEVLHMRSLVVLSGLRMRPFHLDVKPILQPFLALLKKVELEFSRKAGEVNKALENGAAPSQLFEMSRTLYITEEARSNVAQPRPKAMAVDI